MGGATMGYLLDAAIILLLILFIFLGVRRGFVKTIIKLVGTLAAMVVAALLSAAVAAFIFDSFISANIANAIEDKIRESGGSITESVGNFVEEMPAPVAQAIKSFVGEPEDMVKAVNGATHERITGEDIVRCAIRPVAVFLLRIVAFIILFIAAMIAVFFVSRILDRVMKLPALNQINKVLGGVAGAVQGVFVIFALAAFLYIYAMSSPADAVISQNDLNNSLIIGFVAENNPITGALQTALPSGLPGLGKLIGSK